MHVFEIKAHAADELFDLTYHMWYEACTIIYKFKAMYTLDSIADLCCTFKNQQGYSSVFSCFYISFHSKGIVFPLALSGVPCGLETT